MSIPDIIEFATDPQLLGLSLSAVQETILRATYSLPLSSDHRDIFHTITGRDTMPSQPFAEVTVIAGARGGKDSRIAAPIVCYEALFGGHDQHLAKGEFARIPLVAQDARATRIAFSYIDAYLSGSPFLKSKIDDKLASEIKLTNRVSIATFPCTLRSLRGWSIPVGVMSELGFYRLEGQADADTEIQASIRRGMIAFPRTLLVKISTPYLKSGVLHDDFASSWGQDDSDRLVVRASSALMNPTLRAERLDRERRLDPSRFAREYEAQFTDDIATFLPSAWIDAAVLTGRYELPPRDDVRYSAACDPSGGGPDAFTWAIVHTEGCAPDARVVADVVRGRGRVGKTAPDLSGIVAEIAETLRRYQIAEIIGDKYAGSWVRQAFQQQRIQFVDAPIDRSAAYLELEPLFAQGRIDLLDQPTLVRELKTLERRALPGGRTVVDHARGLHDDHSNSLALAAFQAVRHAGANIDPRIWQANARLRAAAQAEPRSVF
jgi:hypothetical protein